METNRLICQFQNRAGAFVRFKTGVRRKSMRFDRKDAGSLSPGLNAPT